MPRRRTPIVVLGAAGVLVAAAVWLFRSAPAAEAAREVERRQGEVASAGEDAVRPPPALTVDGLTLRPTEAARIVDVAGELRAVREVVVGAEIEGRVVEVVAVEHLPVAEGEVLVRLDPELPQAAVARARAALRSAEARRELADTELERRRELSERGVASTAELDRTASEARTAAASVEEARAALLDAETRLAKTRIRAPFAGVVSRLDLEPGAYVRPGEGVADLVDLSELEIEVGVSDQDILALRDGAPARVAVEAVHGRWFEGRVVRPGRTADPVTRRYPVPVRLANPDRLLLPGMIATVRFELGEARPVLQVPRRALLREFDLEYVFRLEPAAGGEAADDVAVARRQRVRTRAVPFRPELLEVEEGLAAGARVAVSGVRELRDGQRVRVREDERAAADARGGPSEAAP